MTLTEFVAYVEAQRVEERRALLQRSAQFLSTLAPEKENA